MYRYGVVTSIPFVTLLQMFYKPGIVACVVVIRGGNGAVGGGTHTHARLLPPPAAAGCCRGFGVGAHL